MSDRGYMPDVFGSHFTLPDLGPVGERLTPSCVDAEPWQISTALSWGSADFSLYCTLRAPMNPGAVDMVAVQCYLEIAVIANKAGV